MIYGMWVPVAVWQCTLRTDISGYVTLLVLHDVFISHARQRRRHDCTSCQCSKIRVFRFFQIQKNAFRLVHKFGLILHLFSNHLLAIIYFYCYGYPTFHDIEQPVICWCAVKKLMITHSRCIDWVVCKTTYKLSVFFKIEKKRNFTFLSCCTRFIEHWFVLIGWSESRTARARLVLKTNVALHCGCSYWSWVQSSSCVCCVQVFTVPWARVSTPSTSAFGRRRSTASPFVVLPRHLFTNCQRRQLLHLRSSATSTTFILLLLLLLLLSLSRSAVVCRTRTQRFDRRAYSVCGRDVWNSAKKLQDWSTGMLHSGEHSTDISLTSLLALNPTIDICTCNTRSICFVWLGTRTLTYSFTRSFITQHVQPQTKNCRPNVLSQLVSRHRRLFPRHAMLAQ